MAKHGDVNTSITIENEDVDEWVDSIKSAMTPPSSSTRIHKVPKILVSETSDIYDKYYVPKVVSIGPYHYNNQKFQLVEKLKPVFTKELMSKCTVDLSTLYIKLAEANMVQDLRNFYEEKSTDKFSDKEFTRMMLHDGCFILYYILFIYGEKAGSCRELRSHQIVFIQQDLFLLENQIPFKVVNEAIKLIKLDRRAREKIESFFTDNILVPGKQKRRWFGCKNGSIQNDQNYAQESLTSIADDHLLHRLHSSLTQTTHIRQPSAKNTTSKVPKDGTRIEQEEITNRCTFRNVNELVDVGIRFKPSSVMSLVHVEFVRRWWFLADVKLPPITVDDSTKPMLLNLIAYEMCADDPHAWVTSYICLLDSLIDHPEDVKTLRKAGVLDNSLGSDKEVATLFNEIGTDLVPNNLAYSNAKSEIQRHYASLRNTGFSQLKHEYIKSPWSFLALLGAVLALFLSGVQTYFTVWGPEGECDSLCKFLKINHHL